MIRMPFANRAVARAALARPIVFLHIPKTAGQSVHNALAGMVGPSRVSPVRVHGQAKNGAPQMPPGYGLYSGHLNWEEGQMPSDPGYVFTVLRDPRERIASFYFYMLKKAQALDPADLEKPEHLPKRALATWSTEDYFFGGPPRLRRFIRDHYDNFYCSYFATRRIRGGGALDGMAAAERVAAAQANLPLIDRVHSILDLGTLEEEIADRYGARISVVESYVNTGQHRRDEARWPKLAARIGSDAALRRLEGYAEADAALIDALGLKV